MIAEIKKLLKQDKLILGLDLTTKALRNSKVNKVFYAKNTPEVVKQDLMHYAKIGNVDIEELELDNDELGDVCKKPFKIAVISVKE